MAEQRSSRPGFVREVLQVGLPLVILAAGGAGYWLLSRPVEAPARPVEEDEAPLVSTVPAQEHEAGLEIRVDGAVVPYREIELSAEIDGRVEFKADVCRAGSYVTRNTLLLKIDPRDYELERDRLGKEVEQAAGDVAELEAEIKNFEKLTELAQKQLDLQEAEFKRQEELHGRRIASDSELGQASLTKLQAENALETLDSQLRVLEERRGRLTAAKEHAAVLLEKAELDLERTELYSPDDADGVIVSDLVEKGDYVRKGTPLVTFEDTSKVEVKCNLRVDELYWLWNEMGDTLEDESNVTGAAYQVPQASAAVVYRIEDQAYEWTGVLSRYDGIGLDETTRTVPCRVVVDDPRKGCVREGDELLCRETR
ncbi:MAG: HlyD family efflux transporter periplasmic adaptor subunit, partial [Planctomycetota bacterium]